MVWILFTLSLFKFASLEHTQLVNNYNLHKINVVLLLLRSQLLGKSGTMNGTMYPWQPGSQLFNLSTHLKDSLFVSDLK